MQDNSVTNSEEQIKKNFSSNLSSLRKSRNLTQLQLAKELNYSDKSVSKWECGDVIPDIATIARIAAFFSVTIDQLIGSIIDEKVLKKKKHVLVTAISCGFTLFVACVIFFFLYAADIGNSWMTFIYALPCTAIVFVVLARLWFHRGTRCFAVSLLDWMLALAGFLACLVHIGFNAWFIFIVALVFQILVPLWFGIVKIKNIKHNNDEKKE